MAKTKIDWCDWVWNPVWGCKFGCLFCYARKIAKRFASKMALLEIDFRKKNLPLIPNIENELINIDKLTTRLKNFEPTVIYANLYKKIPKKSCKIFVNSMSDTFFWPKWVFEIVSSKMCRYPQHIFMFLSKYPKSYLGFEYLPSNVWLGATVLNNDNLVNFQKHLSFLKTTYSGIKIFISIEPMFHEINTNLISKNIDWIIIGAQTNPLRLPKKEWVLSIVNWAKDTKKPIFLKDNLIKLKIKLIKQFPIDIL